MPGLAHRGLRATALAGLAVLALPLSCARCGAPAARSAEELLPPGEGAVVTAPLARLAAAASALAASAAQIPGGEQLGTAARSLTAQLGIDALSREGLLAAGLDPDRGAALSILPLPPGAPRPPWVLALPLTRPEVFTQKLDQLLQQRAGFPLRTEEARGGVKAVVFARQGLAEKVGYALVRGYAVVARGADPAEGLAAAAARKAQDSLMQSPRLAQARQDLGAQDVTVLTAEASELVQRFARRTLPGNAAAGISVQPDGAGLRLRIAQELPAGPLTAINTLLPAGLPPPPLSVPRDALQASARVAPAQLPALLELFAPLRPSLAALREAVAKQGHDLDRDLFAALEPGAALSLGLSAHANLGRAVDPALLDVHTHSPFDLVRLVAAARTAQAARVRATLAAVAEALPALGATVERPVAGARRWPGCTTDAWAVRYPGGEGIEFGLISPSLEACQPPGAPAAAAAAAPAAGDRALVYATGGGGEGGAALLAALARPAKLEGDAAVLAELDLGALAAAIHALPDAAYGTGPQVFVARSLVAQVIDPLQRLRARLELRPTPRGVLVDLALSLAPAPGP